MLTLTVGEHLIGVGVGPRDGVVPPPSEVTVPVVVFPSPQSIVAA